MTTFRSPWRNLSPLPGALRSTSGWAAGTLDKYPLSNSSCRDPEHGMVATQRKHALFPLNCCQSISSTCCSRPRVCRLIWVSSSQIWTRKLDSVLEQSDWHGHLVDPVSAVCILIAQLGGGRAVGTRAGFVFQTRTLYTFIQLCASSASWLFPGVEGNFWMEFYLAEIPVLGKYLVDAQRLTFHPDVLELAPR